MLRDVVEHLAALERAPCSPGEHEAARWIGERLRELGLETRLEEEQVHGTFMRPMGLLAALGAVAGIASLRGRRVLGALAGGFAAASMWEDLSGGSGRWFRRRLPQAPSYNVVAEAGDPDAERTLVVMAHHDAARTSFIFDPTVPHFMVERMPWLIERMDRWPPLMGLVFAGPALVAAGSVTGSRRAIATGTVMSAGSAAVMADMARQQVVPGANDNLTGVAVLLELARRLAESPPEGLRVLLLSTGSEEANQEGILAFARRHFADLPQATTSFVCLDTLGSGDLIMLEGEGFLRMRDYPEPLKAEVAEAAADAGVDLRRGLRLTYATDGLVPLRAGYPTVSIASLDEYLLPSNYHSPNDTPDRVDYDCVADGVRLVENVTRRLALADA